MGQSRLAKRRSRRSRSKTKSETRGWGKKKRNRSGEIRRLLGPGGWLLDQQDRIISRQEEVIAGQKELLSGLQLLNKGLNELCDSKSASTQFLRDVQRESGDIRSNFIQEPVQVNHSELLLRASPRPSQDTGERRANSNSMNMNTVVRCS
jgi:hypothetical protein